MRALCHHTGLSPLSDWHVWAAAPIIWVMKHFPHVSRRAALALGLGGVLSPHLARAATPRPVLIELFTSQGCSSCPPADKLAAKLAQDPKHIVVSFNVDYWDYLGWRDTLAKPEYSQRQYDYAKSRGDGSVYTPQMVINGASHAVGSNSKEVNTRLAAAGAEAMPAQISLEMTAHEISIRIAASKSDGEATLWLMAIAPTIKQVIERGENAGSTISYVNVVRNLVPAAMWKGEDYSGRWMRSAVMPPDCKNIVAVLQRHKVGPVIGIAQA